MVRFPLVHGIENSFTIPEAFETSTDLCSMIAKGFPVIMNTQNVDSVPFSQWLAHTGNVSSNDNDEHLQVIRTVVRM